MSKRNGDVQVVDRRGWEPEAILNWLALSGWGARREPISPSSDSTTVMALHEMISQFDLDALTHRSTSLDPGKLEYINKHHLMQTWSSPEGLHGLADRYTSVENIKQAIALLGGRLTNIRDIPKHAPYLFNDPDLSTDEAKSILERVTPDQRFHPPSLQQLPFDVFPGSGEGRQQ
ncbi:hypothetical protein F5887DRAFT_918944 [Amanita rubescens]|nr:hypothetical protein F5887DRAFT_918944 [Amanita rubescens]